MKISFIWLSPAKHTLEGAWRSRLITIKLPWFRVTSQWLGRYPSKERAREDARHIRAQRNLNVRSLSP
jgi:hypothetical protein